MLLVRYFFEKGMKETMAWSAKPRIKKRRRREEREKVRREKNKRSIPSQSSFFLYHPLIFTKRDEKEKR